MTDKNSRSLKNIRVRPTIYGLGFTGLSLKMATEKSGEILRWQQLQQEQVTAPATILSDRTRISSSGTVIDHDISYEFSAPGQGGSNTSSADIQAQLQEQFLNGETELTSDPEKFSSKPVTGEKFHRSSQLVKPQDYNTISLSGADINIIYAASDPSNSAIANTNAGPALPPILITLLMFSAGLWFLWQGLKHYIHPPAQNIPHSPNP